MREESFIPAVRRERAGKGAARAVRRGGLVPCVVYGEKKDPLMISVDPRVISKGLDQGHFFNTVYTIEVEGVGREQALARDVQVHPVSDHPLHVDFLRVGRDTRISVNVPVVFLNEEQSPGLEAGGQLTIVRHEIEVICRADAIPEQFEVDLSGLEIGDTIRISTIAMPDGVASTITDRDPVVANIESAHIAETDEEAEEAEELEAAEAAAEEEGAEGDEDEASDEDESAEKE